ncbi:uncharacterized protein LOC123350054 [Mauremys mutica]|uniref:Uncharacterized protein n=1 Tax=Mauremys mutica TaxID=74926 RepID=A0A9D3XHR6_9SAUR|nr:uncharacterized protein LOC123350054 [Mauremys mutica]KAH1180799.1 hypothetical protein KIL84_001733 [Mauremys mutica]
METLHPRASLWLLVLGTVVLLGLGTQPVWGIEDNSLLPTDINEEALTKFLIHVKRGMGDIPQYAVATLLPRAACQQPAIAEQEGFTIQASLRDVRAKGKLDRDFSVNQDNFRVAILQRNKYTTSHVEAVLVGTINKRNSRESLEGFLANNRQRYPPNNSCFIFFSLISPCLDYCLNPNSSTYILSDLKQSLQGFDPRFQAFAFKYAYNEDKNKGNTQVWEAWRRIPMPLFRCFFSPHCTRCMETPDNVCFTEILPFSYDNFFG